MAQLVEWLLATPEIRGSNPVMGKFFHGHRTAAVLLVNCIEKTKICIKSVGNVPNFIKEVGTLCEKQSKIT